MIHPSRPLIFASVLALAAAVGLTGCQSSGSTSLNQGASASASIQSAANTVQKARGQVNRTTAALRNLVDRPQDIPAQYKTVLTELKKLRADSENIAKSADNMRAKGDQYLADWARQISSIDNDGLRDAAFARRAEVATKFQDIFISYQTVKSAYLPYLKNLGDIQTVLGTDLSAKGLATVQPFVAEATANAEPLVAALSKLSEEFRAVGFSLKPGGQ